MSQVLPYLIGGMAGASLASAVLWLISRRESEKGGEAEKEKVKEEEGANFGGAGHSWTKADYRFIIAYNHLPNETLAKALGRSENAVATKRSKLGLSSKDKEEESEASEAEIRAVFEGGGGLFAN
mgnify:CR=1 FL=1